MRTKMKRRLTLQLGDIKEKVATSSFTNMCGIVHETQGRAILSEGKYRLKTENMSESTFRTLGEFFAGKHITATPQNYHGLKDVAKELSCESLNEIVKAFESENCHDPDDEIIALRKEVYELRKGLQQQEKVNEKLASELAILRSEQQKMLGIIESLHNAREWHQSDSSAPPSPVPFRVSKAFGSLDTLSSDSAEFDTSCVTLTSKRNNFSWTMLYEAFQSGTLSKSIRGLKCVSSIKIPANITCIHSRCFDDCTSLVEVIFSPDCQLAKIEDEAFCRTGLTKISIPASVETMGTFCFFECHSLSEVTFCEGSQLKEITEGVFSCTALTEVSIPACIEILGPGCFYHCHALSKVTFGDDAQLKSISERAFQSTGLKSVQIPARVESIGSACFYSCSALTAVEFEKESQLKQIDKNTFGRTAVANICIPAGVETIGASAFIECRSLTQVEFEQESQLKKIEERAFARSGLAKICVPENVTAKNIGVEVCYCN